VHFITAFILSNTKASQMAPRPSQQTQAQTEQLNLSDGTTMDVARVNSVDEKIWCKAKKYLESNPSIAKGLQSVSKDADAIRSWLQTQFMDEYYLSQGKKEGKAKNRLKALQKDPELRPVLEMMKDKMKMEGVGAALAVSDDKELMRKISHKMGGVPPEIENAMRKLDLKSLTLHEACKKGDMAGAMAQMANTSVDAKDQKGITPLAYAIGANKPQIVQLLIKNRANLHCVDNGDNTGLHYAAGYGHVELVELLLKAKANVNKANTQNQTPLAVATLNRQQRVCEILAQHGAQA
jgi:hypothetical protein